MILQPSSVELTKVHYYGENRSERNLRISTISRKAYESSYSGNAIIKKNVIGHRWVLKINENSEELKQTSKTRAVLYVLVFFSIIVAVIFGIFISIDKIIISKQTERPSNSYQLPELDKVGQTSNFSQNGLFLNTNIKETEADVNKTTAQHAYCADCVVGEEICLKIEETDKPRCVKASDRDDPTGCGGLCSINTHFCRILDAEVGVFQCAVLTETLECADEDFSCGNMCVPRVKRCDGSRDCAGGLDEVQCDCNLTTHFHCGNFTSCLDLTKKCDKKIHCWDKSDEMDCNSTTKCTIDEFPCQNDQCLHKEKFCDGTVDCLDSSDEPEGCQS